MCWPPPRAPRRWPRPSPSSARPGARPRSRPGIRSHVPRNGPGHAVAGRKILPMAIDLPFRPRRLRTTPAMRRLVAETRLHPGNLVLPMFVKEGLTEPAAIPSMPGVFQHTLPSVRKAAREAVAAGVGGLMLFAVPSRRDAIGSAGTDPDGILQRTLREVS